MVTKEKYEKLNKKYKKAIAWSIDISPEATAYRKKNKLPTILRKDNFKIEEEGDRYLLYDL